MEPLPLAGQEVVVGRLLEQRVAERVVALDRAGAADPVTRTWLPTAVRRASSRSAPFIAGHAGEEVVVDPPAGDGRDADDGLSRFGQGDDAGEEDLPERRRQATARGVLAGPEQFLDEERVAVGAAMDLVGEIAGRRRPEDRRQQRLGLGRVEAAQVDPLDPTARSSSASHGRSGWRRWSSSASDRS